MDAQEVEISQGGITFARMKPVSVIILCWNSLSFLQKFLPSLKANTPADIAEIILVDNASTDGTSDWLTKEHPDLILRILDHNYGYAGGYKIAIEAIESPYVVLLNSDVEVTPGWLNHLLAFMEEHPLAGAVAPKIRSYAYPNHFEYAGAAGGYIDKFGYPFCRGRIFNSIEVDRGQYNYPAKVFWASGACLMVRTEAYRISGELDSHFFAHMEEIDLCWRMHSNNYEVWYCPDSLVYHVGGGALPNESPRKLYLNFRNNLLLLSKNLPANTRSKTMFIRKVLDGIAAVQYLLKGKPSFFMAVLKAHIDFSSLWKREYSHYAGLTHPNPSEIIGWHEHSIVGEFFISGRKKFDQLKS